MKKQLLLLIFLAIAQLTFSQNTGIVSGVITDADGSLSLPGATIALEQGLYYTISDQNGRYEFLNVPEGTYSITASYIGYQTEEKSVTVLEDLNTSMDFVLSTSFAHLDEIIIVGQLIKGQAKALNQQKNSANISNVISSDQVGRFPDANIGDALKRVPGITMQNDQGEARSIIIRGLAPHLNSVTLNGDRIPSAEGDNRNTQMDLIPSDMISTIQVNKTLTPDMDADAIGGSVNLVTRAAPTGQRISATLAGGYVPLRDKGNYTAALVYGNRYANGKLGAVLSASYNNHHFGSDNIEAEWDLTEEDEPFVADFQIRNYNVERMRSSLALALDYEFNDNHSIFANGMYNYRFDRENRFALEYEAEPIYDDNDVFTGYEGSIIRENKGGIGTDKNKNTRFEIQKVQNYSFGGKHLLGPKLDMDWSVNYAKASEEKPDERYIEFENEGVPINMDLRNPRKPLLASPESSPADFIISGISQSDGFTDEEEIGGKLNFRFPFSIVKDQKGRIRTGLRLRLKDKVRDNNSFTYEPGEEFSLADVPTVNFDGKDFQPGSQYVGGRFASAEFLGNLDLQNSSLFEEEADPSEYIAENYNASEKIYAGYIRWDQDISNKFSAIIGARIEHTSIDYIGNYILDEEELVDERHNQNSYTNVLPGITLRYNVMDDFLLRAAITTALARPNYYDLVPYISAIPEDMELVTGNPDLDATYAYNLTNQALRYYQGISSRTMQEEYYKPRYTLGIKFDF